MADVKITIADLENAVANLNDIIEEFENATKNSEILESAIGNPYGHGDLRDKAQDFEERWDDKRHDLTESLKKVKDHISGVLKGFKDWDTQTAVAIAGK